MASYVLVACEQSPEKQGNDLIHETSPYLLQHAYNPVNWKAWNEQTLAQAQKENKLMVISIGYAACHWCHVMEKESFENDTIAQLMNESFVNIKVDREERPDIDQVYVNAVELLTGSAGWPLNCITLPDGRPIFGGTYFTKTQWQKILIDIAKLYKENPQRAIDYADKVTKGLQKANLIAVNTEVASFSADELKKAVEASKSILDMDFGGFKGKTKFPLPNTLDYLLRYDYHFKDTAVSNYVNNTLTKMAYGGLYDQLGGGFSRYAVDQKWHVPHFEKMLYDNAQLVSIYAKAYSATNNALFKQIVSQTLEFVESELQAPNGAFYSSLDADSQNPQGDSEEGAYYTWSKQEIQTILGDDLPVFAAYYNLNEYGYWEKDKYVLIRKQSDLQFAKNHRLNPTALKAKVKSWKQKLLAARAQRSKPKLDDKILTSWNALMLQGYVDAYKALGDEKYLTAAKANANFLLQNQRRKDGGLNRNFKQGKSTINAYLEDYATVIQALLSLYEVTWEPSYLEVVKELLSYTQQHFFDPATSMYFYTSNQDKNLITRKIEVLDGVISSSNALLAESLVNFGHYTFDKASIKRAESMLNNVKSEVLSNALSYSQWLQVMTCLTNPFYEVAVVGEQAEQIKKNLVAQYIPNIIITGSTKDSDQILLQNKYVPGNTLVYVCTNGTCKLPQQDLTKAIKTIKR